MMHRSAAALDREPALVSLLDRELSPEGLASLGGGTGAPVPWRLWSDALYAPLRDFLQRPGKELRAELLSACFHLGGKKEAPPKMLTLSSTTVKIEPHRGHKVTVMGPTMKEKADTKMMVTGLKMVAMTCP